MSERSNRQLAVAALLCGLVLTLCSALGAIPGVVALCLAQPAWALGLRGWLGTRLTPDVLRQDLPLLLGMWVLGPALLGLLGYWPLSRLLAGGSLGSALLLSVVVSAMALLLWRSWPLWQALEADGGPLAARRHLPDSLPWYRWRGLGIGTSLLALCALVLLPLWPQELSAAMRWGMAAAAAVVAPVLHMLIQRLRVEAAAAPAPAPSGPLAEELFAQAALPPAPLEPVVPGQLGIELYEAARGGRVDRALQLLQAGADANTLPPAEGRDQRQLTVLAAVLPDLRLLRALIAAGVDLNLQHRGMTALLAATRDSWHGRPEAVMTLLANGADVRIVDADGNTPLHFAARTSDPGVAALLRDAAAELDVLNNEGYSPLGIACQAGNWRLVRFLLERGAKADVDQGVPALVAAAAGEEDDVAGVQLLLKHKARVDARDRRRRSALHEACAAGHVELIQALMAAGANLEARDQAGRTPFLDACAHARSEAVQVLLPHRPDLHAVDGSGLNAIWLASAADAAQVALVQQLLSLQVDHQLADAHGRRALDMAAAAGRWAIVAVLDPAYELPAAVSEQLGTREAVSMPAQLPDRAPLELLREALGFGNTRGMEALARLCSAAELGELLHEQAVLEQPDSVLWLLEQGADTQRGNAAGDIPVFVLLDMGARGLPVLQLLVERGVCLAGRGGLARWLLACQGQDNDARALEAFALAQLDNGLDSYGSSAAGDPPLSLAVRVGWLQLAQCLLERGADREARDSRNLTALHLATALGREAAIKLLVSHGASPQARTPDGQTPLGVALAKGRRDLADWLDWRVWPLPRRKLRAADVPAAAVVGDADAVRRLIDLGLPVDAVDAQGCTALLRAAGGGHLAVVDLTLARGANPQHAALSGATPLSAAVSMRQLDIVSALLDAGAPIEQRLPGGVSVLMLSAALGLPDVAARLLAAGADELAVDDKGLTALHCAAQYGFTARDRSRLLALYDGLLLAGAPVDQVAAMELTPLLLQLGAGATAGTACDEHVVLAGVERLLDEGVSIEARDARGFGPLHLAALHGLPLLVQRLLRAGADPDMRDTLGRTAREIAIMRGFVDIAGEFEPTVPGVTSMARFLRDNA
ncbi:ankyrin [Stenotrophomonas ginsengisoli]|uniref:Ankyrin n=1 Tax=Stenotrophomonas ginsengisoli TaxID=336566 RepID=A0A0R0D2A5_9GAMM|nr:ankyrin repeat domain-containing protein [Stenotrophomonas ginsengisoli]KRG75595.1 ankyrin [Stenotrophomonas ginsengisoli]